MPRFVHPSDDVARELSGAGQTAPAPDQRAKGWAALPDGYSIPDHAPTLAEARQYCKELATSHYENFSVVTWFLPERLHEHFYSVYAYCRISDDLGDEVGDAAQSLQLLSEWEAELDATYASLAENCCDGASSESAAASRTERGEERRSNSAIPSERSAPVSGAKRVEGPCVCSPRHPVFIALRETIRECGIPQKPFADLLKAFRQDQTITRYESFDDLLGYCRNSANPVGRLVLYVCGYADEPRQQLSDFTCTALQLANFWQDISIDYGKGRIYLPLEDLRRFGVTEADIAQRRVTPAFVELMRFEVERARQWFERGLPLAGRVDRHLAIDIELFTRGGQEILNAIESQGFDVLKARPAIPKWRKLWLVAGAALRSKLG